MGPQVYKEESSGLEYIKIDRGSDKCICLLHGYGANMYDLFSLAEFLDPTFSYDWYFPNGYLELDMGAAYMARAWFPVDMQALELAMQQGTHREFGDANPPELATAINKGQIFFNFLAEKYNNICLGGFSQGAMVTSHLALQNSEKVSGLILFSGNLIAKQQLIKLGEDSSKFPFFQSHGKQDPILSYSGAKDLFELLKLCGYSGEFVSFDGMHEIPMGVLNKVKVFLEKLN